MPQMCKQKFEWKGDKKMKIQVYFEDINGLQEVEVKHIIGYKIVGWAYGHLVLAKGLK